MDRCIADATLTHCCKVYIDDLLIHGTSAEQHLTDVAAALRMLQANGLMAHPDKSLFGADVVEYLEHNVSNHGLSPTAAKVAAVTALPTPTCLHDLRQIMGFINYHRCYEQQPAFATLKAAICTLGLILRHADPECPFTLHTDWSTAGGGAVLGQADDGGQEYMGMWLVTDHQPLTWLMTNPNLTGYHARWALSLQDYTFTIEHRPGNKNADVLSRWPLEASSDGTGAQLDPDPAAALASFPSPTATDPVVWACASY
ncbi:hypothetical protein QJQ45_005643 [Haematococcus lacustris]|nr:hypothetical protein QJQ45_005643 [Haematococcus lacustris]